MCESNFIDWICVDCGAIISAHYWSPPYVCECGCDCFETLDEDEE